MVDPLALAGDLKHDPLSALKRLSTLGDSVHFAWEGCPVQLLNHPRYAIQVLLSEQKKFARSGGPARLATLLGDGLLRSQGEKHLRQRRLAQPAFQAASLLHYGQAMVELAERQFKAIPPGSTVDIHEELSRLMLCIATRAFFKMDLREKVAKVGNAVSAAILNLPPGSTRGREWH